ncbi:MAG: Uma2 family endonuclease [Candidatus Electrothrix sp. AUS1_2]|nr:Uma2 family endonuclease [Candidatus Electrothrix sp. AUS1_2]
MDQAASLHNNVTSAFAPVLCVEVISPSNTIAEMNHKKSLYFEVGAEEFWLCGQTGDMSFYNKNGEISKSRLVTHFPAVIAL